jgi:hypothetical protein
MEFGTLRSFSLYPARRVSFDCVLTPALACLSASLRNKLHSPSTSHALPACVAPRAEETEHDHSPREVIMKVRPKKRVRYLV